MNYNPKKNLAFQASQTFSYRVDTLINSFFYITVNKFLKFVTRLLMCLNILPPGEVWVIIIYFFSAGLKINVFILVTR